MQAVEAYIPPEVVEVLERSGQLKGLSRRAFYEAVEQSPVALMIVDIDANILYINAAFSSLTGYSMADVVGGNASILSDKRTPPQLYRQLWSELLAQRTWSGRLINRRKDGRPFLAELTATPVVDDRGATCYYLGMQRDMTEMHRLELEVQNQQARVESVVAAVPVVIALLDAEGRVLICNDACRALQRAIGERDPVAALLAEARRIGGPGFECADSEGFSDLEVELECAGEVRSFNCSARWTQERDGSADSFFSQSEQSCLLFTAQEITLQKAQQRALRTSALQVMAAEDERIENLRGVLAGAIHRFEGPLNMVEAAIKMLARRGDHSVANVFHEVLKEGRMAVEHLRAVIPSSLNSESEELGLNGLLRDVLAMVTRRLLAAGIEVDWQPGNELPVVKGNPVRLRAAFKQLVENAIDALDGQHDGQRELKIESRSGREEAIVVVTDSGSGIPGPLRFKVFEPFFTTKGRHHGGMGLSMVQEVVNEFGGTVQIDPFHTRGCRVILTLPAADRGEGR
jgi:nitrogen fixation negative regulator NifL